MIRGIVFDLFDTLVDQNHRRLAPIEVDGRRMAATLPELHAFARSQADIDHDLAGFVTLLETVDAELRRDTIDVGVELSTVERFRTLDGGFAIPMPAIIGVGTRAV